MTPAAQLWASGRGFARAAASSVCRLAGQPHWIPDAQSVAEWALWQAAESFDPGRGIPFVSYARRRVRGAVWDLLRQVHAIARAPGSYQPISQRALTGRTGAILESETVEYPLSLVVPGKSPADLALEAEAYARLAELIETALSVRERFVIRALFWEGLSFAEVAAQMGVGVDRVNHLRRKGLETIAREWEVYRKRRPFHERRPFRLKSADEKEVFVMGKCHQPKCPREAVFEHQCPACGWNYCANCMRSHTCPPGK